MVAGTLFGAVALAVSLASSFILYKASGVMQQTADRRISEAAGVAAAANEKAASATERTATLERDAAALRAQAEADRLARIRIEQKLAPRSLTGELNARVLLPIPPRKFETA